MVTQSILPQELKEKTIKDLKNDTVFYTVPWGIFADSYGYMWMNANYTAHVEKGGTVCVQCRFLNGKVFANINHIKEYGYKFHSGSNWENGEKYPVVFVDTVE